MGKITLLLLPLIVLGCEQTFDAIVDSLQNNYQVLSINPAKTVSYRADDSLVTISIQFTAGSEISSVSCDIIASDNSVLNSSPFLLDDAGNNIYSNDFPFSTVYPNGNYSIKFYVRNNTGENQLAAVSNFKYDNGQDNVAPVISNSVVDPDTIVVSATTPILTSVEVFDANGLIDIESVYFIVTRPDGTSNNTKVFLFDDGDTVVHGDQTAGDGVYSLLIQVDENNQKGSYRFAFEAIDRGGKLSNTINHFVLIQ